MPDSETKLIALGADVPVCYRARPCRFLGIGDVIHTIPAPPKLYMLLVWPDAHTPTKDVFARRAWGYQRPIGIPPSFGNAQQFFFFLSRTKNDLFASAVEVSPEIAEAQKAVEAQKNCRLARMSGSGSAVFGLFDSAPDSAAARDYIALHYPDWWVRTAETG